MMSFLFNEQSAIENMIKMNIVDDDNVFITIKDLARYNYFVKHMNDDDNYRNVLEYLRENGNNIDEESIYKIIDDCVRTSKKHPFKKIDEVYITKGELDFIKKMDNIKYEKVAFVLLASAKYYDAARGTNYTTAYLRNSDICKLARITIRACNRDVFMQFAYDNNVLSRHNRAASTEKKVMFASQDENDEVVLKLKENDFKDLAYTYLAYKTPHMFRRCVTCGGWMKKDSKDRRLCKECSNKETSESSVLKEVQCACGKSVFVSKFNSKTYRCEECQKEADDKSNKERQQRWYENHTKPNGNL